jgi:hypothetical protein
VLVLSKTATSAKLGQNTIKNNSAAARSNNDRQIAMMRFMANDQAQAQPLTAHSRLQPQRCDLQ